MIWLIILLVILLIMLAAIIVVHAYLEEAKRQEAIDRAIKALRDVIRHSDETATHCSDVLELCRGKIQAEETLAFKQKHGHSHD